MSTAAIANCGIPATGSEDYRIGTAIALELTNPFSYLGLLRLGGTTMIWRASKREKGAAMAGRGIAFLVTGLLLGGCMQATLDPTTEANFTARDKKLLANAPYNKVSIPTTYQRHVVQFHRKEAPGSVVVDTDARFLYYVLPAGKAIRYGVIVGEDAMAWSGVAKVGRKEEWPGWTPTPDEKRRLGPLPNYVE